jgi:hypothetical protein
MFLLATMGLDLLVLNLLNEGLILYSTPVLLGGLVSGLLVSILMSVVGVMASLHASTVREAGMKLSLVYLVLGLPYFALGFMGDGTRVTITEAASGHLALLVTAGAGILIAVLSLMFYFVARQRFKRSELSLE